MRFASIGSGSSGNGLIVQHADTSILIDCGFSLKEAESRMSRLHFEPQQLDAILVTHEHQDHAAGIARLALKYQIPIVMTYGTMRALHQQLATLLEQDLVNLISSHDDFEIADLLVHPFPVPHDAREPVQYTVSNGANKIGVLTDTGCSTPHIEESLKDCDALILECNHDLEMLKNGPYPATLKNRVSSRIGHLDNGTSAAILSKVKHTRLTSVVAAHISAQNNTPELAQSALSHILGWDKQDILVADQWQGLAWQTL